METSTDLPEFTFGPLISSFLLGITALYLLYWYSTRRHGYWAEKGVPFVKPYPVFGTILDIFKKPFHDVELSRYLKYGPIYGHFEGNRPLLSVADPELIREILVKDFHSFPGGRNLPFGDEIFEKMVSVVRGDEWKRIRTIITPTFTTGKIKKMVNIFKDCSKTLVNNFRRFAEKREAVEVKTIYSAFTMDTIASSAFSTKIDSHNDPNNPFVQSARAAFSRKLNWRAIFILLSPGLMKYIRIEFFPSHVVDFFMNVTCQIVEERKRTGEKRNDFLQLLIDSMEEGIKENKLDASEKDEDIAENYGKIDSDQIIKNTNVKKKLSFKEMVAQCVLFFIGGFETTASTLSFASYCLALNPDIQEKLIQEIDEALKENNGEFTYEAIQSMRYLDNVISETLRLYPPLVKIERLADADHKLGNTGITIPRGMIVSIPNYAMHRDPKYFPDPEKFDPDRFTPEERAKRDQYVYLPFGAGPKNCVAMRFALMEIKVCLAHVLSNFRIKKCAETKEQLEFSVGQPLMWPKSIKLLLEIRKDGVQACN